MLQESFSKNKSRIASTIGAKYPYTYARVSFMRANLISSSDYSKLVKISVPEITSFLESIQYKKEIDELALTYKGYELLEVALNKNLTNTFAKLRRISGKDLSFLIDIYLRRRDISSIKTILRAKYTGSEEQKILGMLAPSQLTIEHLKSLLKKQNIEEILRSSSIPPKIWKDALEKFKETNNLVALENSLDAHYINQTLELAAELPAKNLFRKFLLKEIEIVNLINMLKFKREGIEKKEIASHMFSKSKALSSKTKRLIDLGNEEVAAIIEAEYGENVKRGLSEFKSTGSLARLEIDLHRYLLGIALGLDRARPLLAEAILGYMFAKETEVRNLKLLVKGKQLSLPQEFIEEQIIS